MELADGHVKLVVLWADFSRLCEMKRPVASGSSEFSDVGLRRNRLRANGDRL